MKRCLAVIGLMSLHLAAAGCGGSGESTQSWVRDLTSPTTSGSGADISAYDFSTATYVVRYHQLAIDGKRRRVTFTINGMDVAVADSNATASPDAAVSGPQRLSTQERESIDRLARDVLSRGHVEGDCTDAGSGSVKATFSNGDVRHGSADFCGNAQTIQAILAILKMKY